MSVVCGWALLGSLPGVYSVYTRARAILNLLTTARFTAQVLIDHSAGVSIIAKDPSEPLPEVSAG
ncbi:hypothetical protein B8W72_30840 [Pseudomonas putida]|uniref:Uncharacterized protein n=1 Tax=Pseudomonas putida TaxID=303 RepID=A0A1Y3KB15_PSEPU|nr:hypothetical protein B8W72_30840 [Pseudomonas putida]